MPTGILFGFMGPQLNDLSTDRTEDVRTTGQTDRRDRNDIHRRVPLVLFVTLEHFETPK